MAAARLTRPPAMRQVMYKFLVALLCLGAASAFQAPAVMPQSRIAQSRFVEAAPAVPERVAPASIQMNWPKDADGNPLPAQAEMFDPIYIAIAATPWLALLVTNPF